MNGFANTRCNELAGMNDLTSTSCNNMTGMNDFCNKLWLKIIHTRHIVTTRKSKITRTRQINATIRNHFIIMQ